MAGPYPSVSGRYRPALSQDTLKLLRVSNVSKLYNLSNVSNMSTVVQSFKVVQDYFHLLNLRREHKEKQEKKTTEDYRC